MCVYVCVCVCVWMCGCVDVWVCVCVCVWVGVWVCVVSVGGGGGEDECGGVGVCVEESVGGSALEEE